MIVTKTPLRISLAGGGTDLPAWYRHHGAGAVVSTTIDKHVYVCVNRRFDDSIRISYSQTETVSTVDDIQHDIVRACLRFYGITGGIEIASISDIPGNGTGLGSSSSFTVGLLNALHLYTTGTIAPPRKLASDACLIEMVVLDKKIGKQDQYAAAFGGLNHYTFHPSGFVGVRSVFCDWATEHNLLLFFTRRGRAAATILEDQSHLTDTDTEVQARLRKMKAQADTLALSVGPSLGTVLGDGWQLKRGVAKGVTDDRLDAIYATALVAGAEGGKLLGAGGGGFFLFYAQPENHQTLIQAMRDMDLPHMPFQFDPQGSQVIAGGDTSRLACTPRLN